MAEGEATTCDTREETIHRGGLYRLEMVVEGDSATLVVDGDEKASCDFGPGGIHGGRVGLRIANTHTHFKEVQVRRSTTVRKYYTFNRRGQPSVSISWHQPSTMRSSPPTIWNWRGTGGPGEGAGQ